MDGSGRFGMRYSLRWVSLLLLVVGLFALFAGPAQAAPLKQGGGDFAIPGGRFFTQTGGGRGGFSVVDDGQARFWAEFQRLGGAQTVGYPISRRYTRDGFVTQAFQKLVLQWRPEEGQAWPANVFDELSNAGYNQELYMRRQTPYPIQNFDPPGATWEQIVRSRQGLLNTNPTIRSRYFSVSNPLTVFGLPVSRVEDMGNHWALRTQRAVFQQWKQAVPWAAAGQVTIANGGSIAQELGWLVGDILLPEPAPSAATPVPAPQQSIVRDLLVGPGPRLYALKQGWPTTSAPGTVYLSDNLGTSWRVLATAPCFGTLTMDYSRQDALYMACYSDGLHRWTGSRWERISSQSLAHVAFNYGQAIVWGVDGLKVLRSDDGGRTWVVVGDAPQRGFDTIGLDPRTNSTLYALTRYNVNPATLPLVYRLDTAGFATKIAQPEGSDVWVTGLAVDGRTGDLYVTTGGTSPMSLWRSSNPTQANPGDVAWSRVRQWDTSHAELLAAGDTPGGLSLFANIAPNNSAGSPPLLHRSSDGGRNWYALTMP